MPTTTKLDKGVIKRGIITPDKHFPLHSKEAVDVVCQAIRIIKPDFYVDLGDSGEFSSVSHWQWKKRKRPPLEYQLPRVYEDIGAVNEGMDIIDEALDKVRCKEKYFLNQAGAYLLRRKATCESMFHIKVYGSGTLEKVLQSSHKHWKQQHYPY